MSVKLDGKKRTGKLYDSLSPIKLLKNIKKNGNKKNTKSRTRKK